MTETKTALINQREYEITLLPAFQSNTIAIKLFNMFFGQLLSSGMSLKDLDKDNVVRNLSSIYLDPEEINRILLQLFGSVYITIDSKKVKLSDIADYHFIGDLYSMYELAYEVMQANGFLEQFKKAMSKVSTISKIKKST